MKKDADEVKHLVGLVEGRMEEQPEFLTQNVTTLNPKIDRVSAVRKKLDEKMNTSSRWRAEDPITSLALPHSGSGLVRNE